MGMGGSVGRLGRRRLRYQLVGVGGLERFRGKAGASVPQCGKPENVEPHQLISVGVGGGQCHPWPVVLGVVTDLPFPVHEDEVWAKLGQKYSTPKKTQKT